MQLNVFHVFWQNTLKITNVLSFINQKTKNAAWRYSLVCALYLVFYASVHAQEVDKPNPVAEVTLPRISMFPPFIIRSEEEQWSVIPLPYDYHYRNKNEYLYSLGVVIVRGSKNDNWESALGLYRNSFGLASVYWAPYGQKFDDALGIKNLILRWNAGLIFGYVGKSNEGVPSWNGMTPAVIPSFAYRFSNNMELQFHIVSTVALYLGIKIPLNY